MAMPRIDTVPFASGIDPRHDARRLALLYSLFASAWIILSDVGVGLWSGRAEFQLVLVEIGKGKRPVADITRLLAREPGVRAGATAPPQGLCLMAVHYRGDGEAGHSS